VGLRLRGDAWYLRRVLGGKKVDIALGIYGGERNRKKAEKAAEKRITDDDQARAAMRWNRKQGIEPPKQQADAAITFAGWWERYRDTYSKHKAPKTQASDKTIAGHWLPIFGNLPMADIKASHCLAGVAQRRASTTAHETRKTKSTVTETTVQAERIKLQAMFERAMEEGLIESNPWKTPGVKAAFKSHKHKLTVSRAHRILTEEDEATLIGVLEDERKTKRGLRPPTHPRMIRFIRFMLETGIRIDELLNEHFRDNGESIHVRGKFAKERDVDLTPEARKLLDDQMADPDRPKKEPRPWWQCHQRFWQVLDSGCKLAKIGHLSPHDLRHTFGHRYLTKYNGDIHTLSKILGHSSIEVTATHYAYLRPSDVRARMLTAMKRA
jgi:integrase